jgi:hypothetical protein
VTTFRKKEIFTETASIYYLIEPLLINNNSTSSFFNFVEEGLTNPENYGMFS